MLNDVFCLELFPSPANPLPPPLHPPSHPPINPKIVWSDEYLPSKPLSSLGLYSFVHWPNPHQKDWTPSRPHFCPSLPFFSLARSFSLSLSTSPLFFLSLSLACDPAAHSGSHLVFLIWFYMSPRTHVLSLSPSLSCLLSCSTPLPPSLSLLLVCHRSTTHTLIHTHCDRDHSFLTLA